MVPGKRTVLIVDDEPSIRENLERVLKSSGYETVVAEDGQAALDRAAEQEFEVVLLDIGLPGISGMDVLRRLSGEYPDTCVIMVTAVEEVETAVEAMRSGAYDYLSKPFNLEDILLRVERAREKRYLAQQVRDYQSNLEQRVAQQAKELRERTSQTVEALIREEILAREVEAGGREPQEPRQGTDLRELGAKILRALGRA